jgi:protein gp37
LTEETGIEWTDKTWNPSTGCSKVSEGCKYCYAETMAERLNAMGNPRYEEGFDFNVHWDKIDEPRGWKKPRRVFVNSMSDLFHPNSPVEFLRRVFKVMLDTERHRFQVLTKRPGRMATTLKGFGREGWYERKSHIWLGTSVESARVSERVDALREVPAAVRFLSCEPLIGPIPDLDLEGIHWVIVGGESGNHLWTESTRERRALVEYVDGEWRPRDDRREWVRDIQNRCQAKDVPFFFKQWGGPTSKAAGRELLGTQWNEVPSVSGEFEQPAAQ